MTDPHSDTAADADTDTALPPVVCDMSGAPDTGEQRMAEYARLFAAAFLSRERTATGIRRRLRADPGIADWARDPAARAVLDLVYELPSNPVG